MKWIPVSERLPEEGEWVLWFNSSWRCPFLVANRDQESLDWGGDFLHTLHGFTHWMRLPEPPASAGSAADRRPFAWAVCNPVGTYYRSFGYQREALDCCLQKTRENGDCFYIRALHSAPPQDAVVLLPPLDPNGAPGWNAAIGAVREALAQAGVDWDTE